MSGALIVEGVCCTDKTFKKSLRRIKDPRLQREIRASIQSLLFTDLLNAPARLHVHTHTGKKVASAVNSHQKVTAWTMHVTADDGYKASFTFECSTAYFRFCDRHDDIDKNP